MEGSCSSHAMEMLAGCSIDLGLKLGLTLPKLDITWINEVDCVDSLMIVYESKLGICLIYTKLKLDKIKSTNALCTMKPIFR